MARKKRIVKISQSKNREIFMLLNAGNSIRQTALKAGISERDMRKIMRDEYIVVKHLKKVM